MLPITIAIYFIVLLIVSRRISLKYGDRDYYTGLKESPWLAVAFGMIGASVSGVSFVSVPGMVMTSNFNYLQLCIGFIFGYIAVAYFLLPLYYSLNLTSIYGYLQSRFGDTAKRTGSIVFIISKAFGASAKFYIATLMLWKFAFKEYEMPFILVLSIMLLLTWIYSNKGIRTLVWTDCIQTFMMLTAIILLIAEASKQLNLGAAEAIKTIAENKHSQVFNFNTQDSQYFFKQFISGIFIVIVMTGLDQDMMQKNLTCKNLRSAQKNMVLYGTAFVPLNLLLLSLGILCLTALEATGPTPEKGDALLFTFVSSAGMVAKICFTIGILSSALSSIDSTLVSLTTTISIDLLERERIPVKIIKSISILSILALSSMFYVFSEKHSAIDLIYTFVSFLYGPLLGIFGFGIFTNKKVTHDIAFPIGAILSPLLSFAISEIAIRTTGYKFGYEILLINGLFMFLTLFISARKQ